jgi:predicted DNA-binding protein
MKCGRNIVSNSRGESNSMTTQITLNLPDEIYQKAKHFAQLTNRNIADVLTQVITLSLSPISSQSVPINNLEVTSIASLPDEEVIALTDLQMEPEQDQRLSELLYNQQAGTLTNTEHSELVALMQVYQEKLLLKAQALREAVQRGLREPIDA